MAPMSWRLLLALFLMLARVKADSITGWTTACGSFLTDVANELNRIPGEYANPSTHNHNHYCFGDNTASSAICGLKYIGTNGCDSKGDLSSYTVEVASNCGEVTSFQSSFSSCSGSVTFCTDTATTDCLASIYTNDCKEGGSEACQASLVTVSKKGTDKFQVKSAFVANCKGGKTVSMQCNDKGQLPWQKDDESDESDESHESHESDGSDESHRSHHHHESNESDGSSVGKWMRKWKWYLIGAGALLLLGFLVCVLCCCLLVASRGPKKRKPSSATRRKSSRGRRRRSSAGPRSKVNVNTVVQNAK